MKNKKTLTVLASSLLASTLIQPAFASELKDIDNSYAKGEIESLVKAGVLNGYPDGTFQPRKGMTRQEFAVVLAKSLNLPLDAEASKKFTDVEEWARPYVGALVKAKMTNGVSATQFGSKQKVTREQLAVFYIKSMGLEERANQLKLPVPFSDANLVSDYAKNYVALAAKIGFIQGNGTSFSPKAEADRQATARLAFETYTNEKSYQNNAEIVYQEEQKRIEEEKKQEQEEQNNSNTNNDSDNDHDHGHGGGYTPPSDTTAPTAPVISNTGYVNNATKGSYAITGTGENGSTVLITITDGTTTVSGNGTVDSNGNYSVNVNLTSLNDGTLTITTKLKDASNNTSTETTATITKDASIPTAPTILNSGFINASTNQSAYAINGTGEVGATVEVSINDGTNTITGTGMVNGAGNYSITVDTNTLVQGNLTIVAKQKDLAQNMSTETTSTIEKDTSAPVTPTITNNGYINGLTNQLAYTVTGTAEANATVNVSISDGSTEVTATGTADGSGNYSININTTSLSDGTLTITATTQDAAQNESTQSATIVKDTVVGVPIVSNTGYINGTTDQTSYAIVGTSEANATINITITDSVVGTVATTGTADANGDYSINTNISTLAEGNLTVSVTQTDAAGNISVAGTANVTKDTVADGAPTVSNAGFINFASQGSYNITGTGVVGNQVTVSLTDGVQTVTQTGTIAGDGTFTLPVDASTLNEGAITISATQLDVAGNTSVAGTATVTKDTVVASPVISNASAINGSTIQTSFAITGTGEIGNTVNVSISDGVNPAITGTGTVDGAGNYSVSVNTTSLNQGNVTITVTQIDAVGNSNSATTTITKDTLPPAPATVTNTGYVNNTNQGVYAVTGMGEVGATANVVVKDGTLAQVSGTGVVALNGQYSVNLDLSSLGQGTLTIEVTLQDPAGNTSAMTSNTSVTKDTVADPAVTLATVDGTPVGGPIYINSSTTQASYAVAGTSGVSGNTVTVTVTDGNGLTDTKTGTIAGDGTFSVNADTTLLAEGNLAISVTQTDGAGNVSAVSSTNVIKDVTANAPSITDNGYINIANANAYTVSGTAEANGTVDVTISDGTNPDVTVAGLAVDGTGNFTTNQNVSTLNDGLITISIVQHDPAGNTSAAQTLTVNKDVIAPIAPTVTNTGYVNASTDNAYAITGTGVAGHTVNVTITDSSLATVTASGVVAGDGTFSINSDVSTLAEGALTIDVTQTDEVGNTGPNGTSTVTKDTLVSAPNVTNAGYINAATTQATFAFTGTAEANHTINVTVTDSNGASITGSGLSDGLGDYSIVLDTTTLMEGALTISATSTDLAGNVSTLGTATIIKDTVLPESPVVSNTGFVNSGVQNSYAIEGMGEVGTNLTITISDGVNPDVVVAGTVAGDGTYSVNANVSTLNEGNLTISVHQTDAAGNQSATPGTTTVAKDTVIVSPTVSNGGFINASTDQTTYTVSGTGDIVTGENGNTVDLTVTSSGGGTVTGTGFVNPDGTISINVDTSSLSDGALTITMKQTDAAGNVSANGTSTVTKDTNVSAPTVTNTGYINSTTNQSAYAVIGTSENSASINVTITDKNGLTATGMGTANGSGDYSVAVNTTGLAQGDLTISVTQTDVAGNASVVQTATITKNTTSPNPASLTGSSVSSNSAADGMNTVTIFWNDSSASDIDHYEIYRSTVSGSLGSQLATGITSGTGMYEDTANASTTYYYTVVAVDVAGNKTNSVQTSVDTGVEQ